MKNAGLINRYFIPAESLLHPGSARLRASSTSAWPLLRLGPARFFHLVDFGFLYFVLVPNLGTPLLRFGTIQFNYYTMKLGMIVEHLTERFGDLENVDRKIVDFEHLYGIAKHRFDNDRSFQVNAKKVASQLHEREVGSHSSWKKICELTENDYDLIYKLLHLELNEKGNSVLYIQIAHVCICSIITKSKKDVEELKQCGVLSIGHPDERVLGLHLLAFKEAVNVACTKYTPGTLCDYLYHLCKLFMKLFCAPDCKVHGSRDDTGWLLLCYATAVVIRQCFDMLGITPLYKL